jgi:hypothetical protein
MIFGYQKYLILICACFPFKISKASSVEILGALAGSLSLFRTRGHA